MIQGKKVNLRLIEEGDVNKIIKLTNNLTDRGEFLGLELTSEVLMKKHFNETGYWEKHSGKMLITDKKESVLGNISFYKGVMGYEVGYQIYKKEDRGKGYASEALKLFSAYLFEIKPINRLQISVLNGNEISRRIAEKCGYTYEGTIREAYFARGKYYDVQLFSILRKEHQLLSEPGKL